MANATDPHSAPKTETRRVRDQDNAAPAQSKRPVPEPAPIKRTVYKDWAMI